MISLSRYIRIACLSLLLMASPVIAGSSQEISVTDTTKIAQDAFNRGDYREALALWLNAAKQGSAEAQVFVGLAHANGWGVSKNINKAVSWYHRAAENNSPSGQLLLGLYYVQKSNSEERASGLYWLRAAAGQGDKTAQNFLDKGFANGWFTDISHQELNNKPSTPLAIASSLD